MSQPEQLLVANLSRKHGGYMCTRKTTPGAHVLQEADLINLGGLGHFTTAKEQGDFLFNNLLKQCESF
jgi:hypothetical protein